MLTDYKSTWGVEPRPHSLSAESFQALLEGTVPYIHVPALISQDVSAKLEQELLPRITPYLHAVGPRLLKVGVAQFEFQALSQSDLMNRSNDMKDRYFQEVEKVQSLHEDLEKVVGQNVWKTVVERLQSILPDRDVIVANEGEGRAYFSGIFRAINDSTPIHCDWSPYDSRTEDWIIKDVTMQGVFNLYLTPFKGGRTEVYDVQWTPEALQYRDPDSYGYGSEIVEGRSRVAIEPQVGDLVFFNSRNMHKVFPVEKEEHEDGKHLVDGKRARITLSSFLGTLPAKGEGEKPKIILWS